MIQTAAFWLLLALSVPIFWWLRPSVRYGFLALVSIGYLAFLQPVPVLAFLAWALVVHWAAHRAASTPDRARVYVVPLVVAILLYLAFYKYQNRLAVYFPDVLSHDAIIPLGISYFTFKLIHYAIEVGRGNITERSWQLFLSYVFLYPIFTAGPIERFDHYLGSRQSGWNPASAIEGLTRIVYGLIKIFIVARVGVVAVQAAIVGDSVRTAGDLVWNLSDVHPVQIWLYLFCSYIYTYVDFSAYTDIAIGASRLYGIGILENFNFPFVASNVSEFWKRWHMTLAGWCQRYAYLPTLGATRNPVLSTYVTFIVMGLWHSGGPALWTNWFLWGVYHGSGVSAHLLWTRYRKRRWPKAPRSRLGQALGIAATLLFVSGSYAFSSTSAYGGWTGIRLFARLFGLTL